MRKFTFNRKTIYVTEKEWKALFARWDLKKVKQDLWGNFGIKSPCVFCRGNTRCGTCPLDTFRGDLDPYGCIYLARGLVEKYGNLSDFDSLQLDTAEIYWDPENDRNARNAIRAIRKGIRSAVKVKKKGG